MDLKHLRQLAVILFIFSLISCAGSTEDENTQNTSETGSAENTVLNSPVNTDQNILDQIAPSAPGNLTSISITNTNVQLTWSLSTDNVGTEGYQVFRNNTHIATTTSNSYTDTTLSPSTTYTYLVVAFDAADNISLSSNQIAITSLSGQISKSIYYISPAGNNASDGQSPATAWKTFSHAFSNMNGSDELILMDGNYNLINGTGGIHWDTSSFPGSGQPPSGINIQNPTIIRAFNAGKVNIEIPLIIGRSFRKDSNIIIKDISFDGKTNRAGHLYNTSYVTIKNCGFNGGFSIGTNDHHDGNSYNLIEDSWIWATNTRIIASNYRAHNNVWRRVLVRSEGCDYEGCDGPNGKRDPSVGITVYDSHDVSLQNVLVIDRILRNDQAYGDFATAQHTNDIQYYLGRNEWLGNMSVNSDDQGMHFEADLILSSPANIWKIKDFVAIGNSAGGINIGNTPYNYTSAGAPASSIENATILLSNLLDNTSAIRVSPQQTNVIVRNSITTNASRTGYNVTASSVEDSLGYNPGASLGDFDASSCTNCVSLLDHPVSDNSILYPTQIENGSVIDNLFPAKKVGADIAMRYGIDGTRYGDTGYNTKTDSSLWPWPNEDRIKKEMCTDINVSRGFCSTSTQANSTDTITLTSYVWEFLGNAMPDYLYGNPATENCNLDTILCVDDTAGLQQEYPTIQEAVSVARPGDTVLVHSGTYEGFRISTSGTIQNRITIKAASNDVNLTSPGATSGNDIVYISNASYITIDGFNISGAPVYGIGSHDASATSPMLGLEIKNNIVSNSTSTNIYLSQSAESIIENNNTFNSINSHGIYLSNAGSDNTIIRGNISYGNAKNGIHFNGDARNGGDGLHKGILIEANILYGNVQSGVDADGLYDSSFVNNLIHNNGRHGIRGFQVDSSAGVGNLVFINNTIVDNGSWAIKLTDDIGGHTIFNNIMTGNSLGCIVTSNATVSSDNNIFNDFCTFSIDGELSILQYSQWSSIYDITSITSSNANLFVNSALQDYSLLPTSPGVNFGINSYSGYSAPQTDINGTGRPVSGAIDVGAYENH